MQLKWVLVIDDCNGKTFSQCQLVMYPPGGAFENWETIKCDTGQPLDGALSYNGDARWPFTV